VTLIKESPVSLHTNNRQALSTFTPDFMETSKLGKFFLGQNGVLAWSGLTFQSMTSVLLPRKTMPCWQDTGVRPMPLEEIFERDT
jgi:hypothetical protein